MRNIHEREIDAPAETVGGLLDQLGGAGDRVWPSPAWVPMRLDRPLGVGADGGHGPVRYHVSAYEPGRRVRFEFHPRTGLVGFHEFTVDQLGVDRCRVRHVLEARPHGVMRVALPLAVRSMHDAVLEDALDNLELAATGSLRSRSVWSPWARVCWHLVEQSGVRSVPVPENADLIRGLYVRPDLEDSWQVALRPGMSSRPQEWTDAIFRRPGPLLRALFVARAGFVRLLGIESEPITEDAFGIVATSEREVLLGSDAGHLDFRASVFVDERAVTVSTVARTHNARGRRYLAAIAPIHPILVRGLLRRAVRTMAMRAMPSGSA